VPLTRIAPGFAASDNFSVKIATQKHDKAIYYAIVLVPLAFVVIFLFGLFPDFVYHATKP
jgi:inner membrane protein involved in colicin E2 resistance